MQVSGQGLFNSAGQSLYQSGGSQARDLGVRVSQPVEDELRSGYGRSLGRRRRLGAVGAGSQGRARWQLRVERRGGATAGQRRSQARARRRSDRRSRRTLTRRRLRSRAATSIAARVCPASRAPTFTVIIRPGSSGRFVRRRGRSRGRPSWRGRRCIWPPSVRRTTASSCSSITIELTRSSDSSHRRPRRRETAFPTS